MAAKQITVWGENRPGNLAKITGAVAGKGVNIQAIFASDAKGRSAVRLLVSDAARAKSGLKAAGFHVTEEPHIVLNLADKPGQLARAAEKLRKARVNIHYSYASVSPRAKRGNIVLGVSNAVAARRALR